MSSCSLYSKMGSPTESLRGRQGWDGEATRAFTQLTQKMKKFFLLQRYTIGFITTGDPVSWVQNL